MFPYMVETFVMLIELYINCNGTESVHCGSGPQGNFDKVLKVQQKFFTQRLVLKKTVFLRGRVC